MRRLESAGWISKLGSQIVSLFSREEYQERVESGLISTLDGVIKWLKAHKDTVGKYSDDKKCDEYLDHFVRQYDANRPKLK